MIPDGYLHYYNIANADDICDFSIEIRIQICE